MISRRPGTGLTKRPLTIDVSDTHHRPTTAAGTAISGGRSSVLSPSVARSPRSPARRQTIHDLLMGSMGPPNSARKVDDMPCGKTQTQVEQAGGAVSSAREPRNSSTGSKTITTTTTEESLGAKAVKLSKDWRITFSEAKEILEAYDKSFNKCPPGPFSRWGKQMLREFLCHIFHAKAIPDNTLDDIYRCTCQPCRGNPSGKFSMEAFLAWYMCSFTTVAKLQGDPAAIKKTTVLTNLCNNLGIEATDLDKIKKVFDKHDTDGSGTMEKDEFEVMIAAYLGAKREDISQYRLDNWWREIDLDGSGLVEFDEFVQWYLKYFGSADSMNPSEAFYASYNPSVQRLAMLTA